MAPDARTSARSVADLLSSAAFAAPEKTALIFADRAVTYAELDVEADRVAGGLQRFGVGPGDRVAIAMHNIPHFVYSYFGILRAGAVAVPLNALLTQPEVEAILADAGVRVVLGARPFGELVAAVAAGVAGVEAVVLAGEWDKLGRPGASNRDVDVSGDDLAVLAYTSGTTGQPKGAMLSHANLLANLRQQMALPEPVSQDDVLWLALPLFHIFGLNVALGLLVLNAATGVLVEKFDPVASLRLIEEKRVSLLFGPPTMYAALASVPGADQYDLSAVRLAVSGAAPLPPDVLLAFRDLFGVQIYEGYGLTETAPTLTSSRMGAEARPGSIGKPLPEIELRLVDDEGGDVERGDPGEVVVRGPNVFKGYWNREEETAQAFRDGWFHTGDVAVEDDDGYLYLVDRKRDLINVSGFNVFPSEVEAALLRHPKVAEAAVVGVPHPYSGEAVKAYVVLEPGAEATPEELLTELETRLARFKRPRSLEIVDALPHAVTGKVLRRALRT